MSLWLVENNYRELYEYTDPIILLSFVSYIYFNLL